MRSGYWMGAGAAAAIAAISVVGFEDITETMGGVGDIFTTSGSIYATGQIYSNMQTVFTPSGTTQTIDWDDGNVAEVDLESASGGVTLTLSNPNSGGSYGIVFIQDSASALDITWPSNVKWPGGVTPVISTGADAYDVVTCIYVEDQYYCDRGADYQ